MIYFLSSICGSNTAIFNFLTLIYLDVKAKNKKLKYMNTRSKRKPTPSNMYFG